MGQLTKLMCALLITSSLIVAMVGCAKPLTLSIIAPINGTTVDKSPVEVKGFVSDAKATVWVGDSIVTVSKKGYYSTKLEPTEGENTFIVTAAKGKPGNWKETVAWTVTVTYKPK